MNNKFTSLYFHHFTSGGTRCQCRACRSHFCSGSLLLKATRPRPLMRGRTRCETSLGGKTLMMDVPQQQPPEAVAADAVGLLRLQLVYASERVLKMYVCRAIRKKRTKNYLTRVLFENSRKKNMIRREFSNVLCCVFPSQLWH